MENLLESNEQPTYTTQYDVMKNFFAPELLAGLDRYPTLSPRNQLILRKAIMGGQSDLALELRKELEGGQFLTYDPRSLYREIELAEHGITFSEGIDQAFPDANGDWEQVATQILTQPGKTKKALAHLMNTFGFIPEELWQTEVFRNAATNNPNIITPLLNGLQNSALKGWQKEAANEERSVMLNHLIADGVFDEWFLDNREDPAFLDVGGLMIKMGAINTHIPYGLLGDAARNHLHQIGVINEEQLHEATCVHHKENQDWQSYVESMSAHTKNHLALFKGCHTIEDLLEYIGSNPYEYATRLIDHQAVIPTEVILHMLANDPQQNTHVLFSIAEHIGHDLSEIDVEQHKAFSQRRILQDHYNSRQSLLHSPEYYPANKIATIILETSHLLEESQQPSLFVGKFKRQRKRQHTFVQTIHRGATARVLVDESQILNPVTQQGYEALPKLNRKHFESVESSAQVLDTFTYTVGVFSQWNLSEDQPIPEKYRKAFWGMVNFINTNASELHDSVLDDLEYRFTHEEFSQQDKDAVIELCHRVINLTEDRINEVIASSDANPEIFTYPEIVKQEHTFSLDAFEQLTPHVLPYGINKDLYDEKYEGIKFRIAYLDHTIAQPGDLIPQELTENALNAIRVRRDVPLINVIGGAKFVGDEHADALDKIAAAVVNAGHHSHANVSIPGTQSGLGVAMSKANLDYLLQNETLSHRERMHMIAITPAGALAFEDNPLQRDGAQNYAPSAVDHIMTPVDPKWELSERGKTNRNYPRHISYMESAYGISTLDHPKVMVIGNGGYYSILEINESLKYDFKMLLIKGSGRFADIAGYVFDTMSRANIGEKSQTDFDKYIRETITSSFLPEQTVQEFFAKDFGEQDQAQSEAEELYRQTLRIFFLRIYQNQNRIQTTDLESLEDDLRNYI